VGYEQKAGVPTFLRTDLPAKHAERDLGGGRDLSRGGRSNRYCSRSERKSHPSKNGAANDRRESAIGGYDLISCSADLDDPDASAVAELH
jgi:hypothetical protein